MKRFWVMLFIVLMVACDSNESHESARPTPSPTSVAWQRAEQVITLDNALQVELIGRLDEHETTVVTLQFSPDSVYLATASTGDGRVRVWNLASGQTILSINDLNARWLFFSPNNETFITVDQDLNITEWSMATQETLITLPAQNASIGTITQSNDLTRLAIGGRAGRVYLFSINPLTALGYIDANPIVAVQEVLLTPDGEQVVTLGDGGTLRVWSFSTLAMLHDFGRITPEPISLAISPDGKLVAGSFQRELRLWRLDNYTLEQVIPVEENAAVAGLTFSPDGSKLVAYGVNGVITMWDIVTGQVLVQLPDHTRDLAGIVFSADQNILLTGSRDNKLFLWNLTVLNDLEPGDSEVQIQRRSLAPPNTEIYRLGWSPNEEWIVFSDPLGRVYTLGIPSDD